MRILSAHPALGALVYSWGSFEIGRMFFGMRRLRGALLWGGLGTLTAIIYILVTVIRGQLFGAILLGITAALQIWLMKRWFRSGSHKEG